MTKKILLISTEFPPGPGGIGQHAFSLAKALTEREHPLVVLTNSDYTTNKESDTFDDKQQFEIIRYPRFIRLFTYVSRLFITIRTIIHHQPLTIILTGKFSLWQGVLIKLIFRKMRTVAILHGTEVNLPNWILRKWTHYAISRADVLIPVSNFTKELLPYKILKNASIVVIPNGIESEMLNVKEIEPINLAGNPKLLTVGHVSPRKGQQNVIAALPELIRAFPQIHYHIVGRPIIQNQLERLASALGVLEHITFHGRIADHSNLWPYYDSADIFMLLSENLSNGDVEGFGIVALEANCFGLPVIGSNDSGVAEAVNHNSSGVLVESKNSAAIVAAVQTCIANKDGFAIEAKNWASKHQWQALVSSFEQILK